MTRQTITALFDKRSEATQAIDELVKAGISRTSIKLFPETEVASASTTSPRTAYDTTRDEKGFWATLADLFMPDEDRYTYAEAMHRGSIMVTVTVDEAQAAYAQDILEEHGTVNIDEREASWRKEGWTGYSAGTSATAARTGVTGGAARAGEEVIPVVDEQLKVGKRQVEGGRVKVRSYVVETPVSEQVNLRTENVHVERRPVDRAVSGDHAFRERTIEAQSTSEEAVVSKDARVKEELVVKKEVGERTETVSDTVRSTKVDIDDERTNASRFDRKDAQRRGSNA